MTYKRQRDNDEVIKRESDLPDPVSGVRTLKQDTTYVINGHVETADSIEFAPGSGMYGENYPQDILDYTGTGDLFINESTADVFLRNLQVNAPSGRVFNVSGTSTERFFVQSCAFVNCDNLGLVDGFKVPNIKLTDFTNFNSGLTFTGNPNKVYMNVCPLRDTSLSTAIQFDGSFVADHVQLDNLFFKNFNNDADALRFDGTLNEKGLVRGCIFGPTVQNRTVNFDETSLNWTFADNEGIQDSRKFGLYDLDTATTTTISTQDTYTKIAGSTTARDVERFTHSGTNKLTYDGKKTVDVSADVAISLSAANTTVGVAVFKNQSLIPGGEMTVDTSGSNSPVNMSVIGSTEIQTNDEVEVYVKDVDGTNDITVDNMVVRVSE